MVKKTNRGLMENDRRGLGLDWGGRKDGSEEAAFQPRQEEVRKEGNLEKNLLSGGANRSEGRKF